MIEVKRDDKKANQGFPIKLTLNSYSNYLTEGAATELRDKLMAALPSTNKPDPRDALNPAEKEWRAELLSLRDEVIALREQVDRQKAVFQWLLGEDGDFPQSEPGHRYNWRIELRKRLAAIEGEGQ